MIQRFSVKELIEIDQRSIGIIPIVWIGAMRLGVFPLYSIEMVSRPIDRISESGRILDGQVVLMAGTYYGQSR